MGTISDKLMRIINTKEDIRQALISKGYDVPTSIPFKEYAKMILDLPCKVDSFPDIEGIVARYSASGLTNEQMAANLVWVDKTGNGHDLQLKNFAWKGMSGVGGYVADIDEWGTNSTAAYFERNSIKITATFKENVSLGLLYHNIKLRQSCVLKVTGIPEGCDAFLDDRLGNRFYMSEDGVYEIIPSNFLAEALYFSIEKYPERWYGSKLTIEQLPLYPGALVFDGVDDYGTCDNFPVLTKEKGYTVVALRQWIEEKNDSTALVSNCKNWGQDGAFLFEYNNLRINFLNVAISFGHVSSVDRGKSPFSYQTSKLYNGKNIEPGSFIGSNELVVGKGNKDFPTVSKVAIWELIILDHDATEEELTKIKNYFVKTYPWLFFDQAWTVTGKTNEDEDRATIANITGNGNDLRLSNFGFAEGSGYGDYPFKPSASLSEGQPYGTLHFKTDGLYSNLVKSNVNSIQIKFNLRDMPEGGILSVRALDINTALVIKGESYTTDGSYEFVYDDPSKPVNIVFYNGTSSTGQFNFYVDIIPEYEGYLVTDGVDDTGRAVNLTISKDFTLVGEWILFSKTSVNAGLSIHPQIHIFNRPEAIQITFRTAGKTLPVKSLKVICSDGRCYDENWNEFKINVGEFISSNGVLYVASNGTYHTQIAFKNLGIYNNQILSKDDCIKAYNYLQTLKAK